MAQQEGVHGPVPVARVLVPRCAVPPVGVEAAVGEEGEFGQHIELFFYGVSGVGKAMMGENCGRKTKHGGRFENLQYIPKSHTTTAEFPALMGIRDH